MKLDDAVVRVSAMIFEKSGCSAVVLVMIKASVYAQQV